MKKVKTPYWTGVIAKAITRKNKGLTPFSLDHIHKSKDWQTCACGKLDPRIARDGESGAPLDLVLDNLGDKFLTALIDQNPHGARAFMRLIEKRSVKLLREGGHI